MVARNQDIDLRLGSVTNEVCTLKEVMRLFWSSVFLFGCSLRSLLTRRTYRKCQVLGGIVGLNMKIMHLSNT